MKLFFSLLLVASLSASEPVILLPITVEANSTYSTIPEYRDNKVDFSAIQTSQGWCLRCQCGRSQ